MGMRKPVLLMASMALAMLLVSGVALAAIVNCEEGASDCVGTNNPDTLNGSDGEDWMYGLRGDDKLYGNAGGDPIRGGRGNDTIRGGGEQTSSPTIWRATTRFMAAEAPTSWWMTHNDVHQTA
jgi:hypothetical protein